MRMSNSPYTRTEFRADLKYAIAGSHVTCSGASSELDQLLSQIIAEYPHPNPELVRAARSQFRRDQRPSDVGPES